MKQAGTAAAVLCVAVATMSAQQRSLFRAESDLVHFAVTVLDEDGSVVTDLTADDFELRENDAPQTITQFARSDDTSAPELHLGLMLDTSESMLADLAVAQTAAIRFFNRVPEAADLTLVSVDSEVSVSRFSQDDFPRLVERIRSSTSAGYTALYDAFAVYLDGTVDDDGRSVLVAFTDGGDSRSSLDFGDTVDIVRASAAATIYVVGLLDHVGSNDRNVQRVRLSQIADASGGRAIFPRSMRQIEDAYDEILAEMRAQYSLGYVSTDQRRDGGWREVEIRIRTPDRRNLRVRTRSGYFAPVGVDP